MGYLHTALFEQGLDGLGDIRANALKGLEQVGLLMASQEDDEALSRDMGDLVWFLATMAKDVDQIESDAERFRFAESGKRLTRMAEANGEIIYRTDNIPERWWLIKNNRPTVIGDWEARQWYEEHHPNQVSEIFGEDEE